MGGGVLLGAYFESPEEASLRQPPEVVPVTDPLRNEVLEQIFSLRGTLAPEQRAPVRFDSELEGRIITALPVEAGQEVTSGQVFIEVEGRPVIILTGAFPMWRDLTWPIRPGPDISQLQTALTELGFYSDDVDGNYEASTLRAVFALYKSIGYEPPTRSAVDRLEFVFVPPDLRIIDRLDAHVGDALRLDSITLATAARRIEAELTFDQRQTITPGQIIRTLETSGDDSWSSAIEQVVEIQPNADNGSPTTAIVTREPIPASFGAGHAFVVVLESSGEPILSASPAAVHMNDEGETIVVVLDGIKETVVPVRVGMVTEARVEVAPQVPGTLEAGDLLVLNPDR